MWFPIQVASVACWGLINVLDSLLVENYHKHPLVPMWNQSYWNVSVLLIAAFFFPMQTTWLWILLAGGVCAYVGDIVFFVALRKLDTSVTNIAWGILAIFLAICGYFFFHEVWSSWQSLGVLLVLGGVTPLSLWHRRVGDPVALLLLPTLALIYLPYYVIQKAALLDGQSITAVFVWPLLAREGTSFIVPLLHPRFRCMVTTAARESGVWFHAVNAAVIVFFVMATYLSVRAYAVGPISLISVVGNVQPFFVLFFGWMLWKLLPRYASKEILTAQSIVVKLLSFCIVFAGLALIALPH